jgi:argininosuccinate lyase
MMHLSRLSEDLIVWSTAEFGFVELSDDLTTGSSIMPQKKNPDPLELIRGKTGRIYGHLLGLLTMMKGLPLAYNRDMQEDKEPLFDTVETLGRAVPLMSLVVTGLSFNHEKMRAAAQDPFLTATDLADHLVRRGVPFRRAHETVGGAVRYCLEHGLALAELTDEQLAELCPGAAPGIAGKLTVAASLKARVSSGGTAPRRVKAALKRALNQLERNKQA